MSLSGVSLVLAIVNLLYQLFAETCFPCSQITRQASEMSELTRVDRIGTHSHIRGLGLNELLQPKPVSCPWLKLFFRDLFFLRCSRYVREWLAN